LVYYTEDEELHSALITFMRPQDSKIKETGLYQYKDLLFRTSAVTFAGSINIGEDELRVLVENFEATYGDHEDSERFSALLELDQLKGLLSEVANISEPYDRNEYVREKFQVSRLKTVRVRFANDICQLYCSHCKELFFEHDVELDRRYNRYRCKKCSRPLTNTPVWVLKRRDPANLDRKVVHPLPVWISGDKNLKSPELWHAWFERRFVKCPKCKQGVLNGFRSLDPARLLLSARITCSNCGNMFSLWSNKGLYSLTMPSENLTSAFVVSTYNKLSLSINSRDLIPILSSQECFDTEGLEKFVFAPEAKIKEIVLGYWYGANVRDIIKADRVGRELVTGALNLKLKDEYFVLAHKFMAQVLKEHPDFSERIGSVRPEDISFRRLVLHTIAHALVSRLPVTSGIGMDNFAYLYDLKKNSVIVYETAPGGLGACAELTQKTSSGEPIAVEFFSILKEDVTRCTCDDRCKYCVAIQGCAQWNRERYSFGSIRLRPA
jgi:RNase P subunit RPR2